MTQRLSAAFAVLMIFFSTFAFAERLGHEGNGGDAIEAFFLEKGSNLLARLSRTPEGQNFLRGLPVTLTELSETLDFAKIYVYSGLLLDSTNAVVDAVVTDGIIYLSREAWLVHIQAHNNVDTLVLHEMLRSAGVNDDNYRYSKNVSMYSDLLDPREAMTLSQYINPYEVELKLTNQDQMLPIDSFSYINNMDMKLQVGIENTTERNLIFGAKEKTFNLNIPLYSTGYTKIVVYRIDYEYSGLLAKGATFQSERTTRFQSSTNAIEQKSEDGGKKELKKITVIDLLDTQTIYKESLQLQIKNKIQARRQDAYSHMYLRNIVIYFNILRL